MKWALALLLAGAVIAGFSYWRLGRSGFDDGSFEVAIIGVIVGAVVVGGSLIWLYDLLFMGN